jgi:hypothetical protein
MNDSLVAAQGRPRLKKKPHNLHRCSSVEELIEELRANDVDLVSLVSEFIKPSFDAGILVAGSITANVATELSDLDVLVLTPGAEAFKTRRKRDISASSVNQFSAVAGDSVEITVFLSGIELNVVFMVNPAIGRFVEAGGVRESPLNQDKHAVNDTFLSRLATGWVVDGHNVVEHWRKYYETDRLPVRWMAVEFTVASKNLEDMEAGVGLAKGHVAAIGAYAVGCLLRALLAYNGTYSMSIKYMRRIDALIATADPEMRDALITGRRLAFPALFETAGEEKAYFEEVYSYCRTVRDILSRDEAMTDVLASIIHDLDIIL